MKAHADCIPCFLRQGLDAARHAAPGDEAFHRRLLSELCRRVADIPEDLPPPLMAEILHDLVCERTGLEDPYARAKAVNLERARAMIPRLSAWLDRQPHRFEAVVRIAIAGNIIDLGANRDFDLEAELVRLESQVDALEAMAQLHREVEAAKWILYIGDNVEEALFDRFLIEELAPRKVYFATRSRPILNDITESIAHQLGLGECATILSSGSPIPGTDLERVSDEFRELFETAPVVIAKGQGNFETLSDADRPIYFLFKVKCGVVARETGYAQGSSVVYLGGKREAILECTTP